MKKFVWRLQRVLEINQKKLQAKKAELFKIAEQLALARVNLLAQKRILQNEIEKVAKDGTSQRLNSQELLLKSCRINDKIIKNITKQIQELQTLKEQATREYIKMKNFTEGLEKLREKAKAEHIKQQEKLEQKQDDEQTSIRFVRDLLKIR